MALTAVRNLQLHNQIERVLHVPGNYRGGILEMAIVVDRAFERETARELCADIIASCKKQSDVFRNIRLNMILWGQEGIHTEIVASAYVQMGTFFDSYEEEAAMASGGKSLAGPETEVEPDRKAGTGGKDGEAVLEIMEYLKKFQARSKLILLLTPDREKFYQAADRDRLQKALSPFLKQKLILVYPEGMESGIRLFIGQ